MFERFTQTALSVVMFAHDEAQPLGYKEVGTTQLLLGLIRLETGLAALVLRDAGVTLENARIEVEKIQGRGTGYGGEISYNQLTRQVFDFSGEEADKLNDSEIDTQHLLLGLLRQAEGGAVRVLQELGIDPNQLRIKVLRKLAEQGHPTASQFLPDPPPINHNGTNSNKAHLDLIRKILKNPEGLEAQFVRNNPGIIEPELIESVALILEQEGADKGARVLRALLNPISEEKIKVADNLPENSVPVSQPEISSFPEISVLVPEPVQLPDPPQNIEPIIEVPAPTNQEMEKFIFQVLRVTFESQADEQVVYQFLGDNLDKLNDRFPEILLNWWFSRFTSIDKNQKHNLAKRFFKISSLIRKFDGGSRGTNLEIALTGYNIVSSIFTQAEYPENWAKTQNCLGLTYLERVQGNREENLKQAIACFEAALSFYSQEQFPKERQVILASLRKAATDFRNLSEKQESVEMMAQNPDRRILGYYTLIEQLLRTPQNQHQTILDESSELLDAGLIEMMRAKGQAEKNRGNVQDGELLIAIAEKLTENLTLSSYSLPNSSEKSGENTMNQMNFLKELCSLVFNYDANPQYIYPYLQKNLNFLNDELIDILRNTFWPRLRTVSLEEAQGWAYSLGNLGRLLTDFLYGDKPTNVEIAIISLQISASIYEKTKAINPQNWILTQGELAKAYRNRIKGNPEENIEQSINLYLETLKFFDENSLEWAKVLSNLAVAYIHRIKGNKKENFYLAAECFKQSSNIHLKQGFTDGWAALEYNLGNFYGDLIKLKLGYNPKTSK
ncbi:MAG: hypothetical protein HGA42_08180 [Nostocales cyanobacterium W4_Combined_metabat2_030]|nr:hypothetical protein [Nostocales cyanobacterium W4_Combined_metabat2_030]